MNGEYDTDSVVRDFHERYRVGDGASRDEDGAIATFRGIICDFYRRFGRHDLPWRKTADPYHIVVSEIMLQQTQVGRVIGKYVEFIRRFPGIDALAESTLHDVLAVWQGLGYNRRGKYLLEFARAVRDLHDGRIPDEPEILAGLPGIGKATASSIAVFAFNKPVPFIETNVRTVVIHFFFPGSEQVSDGEIRPWVTATMDGENPRDWFSALMDYGTMLKKKYGNPSRKSAHYKTQGRFTGSTRELRGKVLRHLLSVPAGSVIEMAAHYSAPTERLVAVCDDLAREGLITIDGEYIRINRS